jgi:hypothetical protein
MNIIIAIDKKDGMATLTTDSPLSHYGVPVLRIEADDINGDFGPADILDSKKGLTAADVVAGWAIDKDRTLEERNIAQKYLSQWPDNPKKELLEKLNIKISAGSLGRKGGSSKTEAKQKASAENGKKGGRPKKIKE